MNRKLIYFGKWGKKLLNRMGDLEQQYQHLLRAQERDRVESVNRLEPTNLTKVDPIVSQSITGHKA